MPVFCMRCRRILKDAEGLHYSAVCENFGESQEECMARASKLASLPPRPTVVCLCGSTRFKEEYLEAQLQETLAGKIVLTVGGYMHADKVALTPEEKEALDELHLRKIELADEVLILNRDGYIGRSTTNELDHARKLRKKIRYLEPEMVRDESFGE